MTSADFPGMGEDVVILEIPEEVVAPFEWPDDEGCVYDWRGFLVPAAVVNEYPRRLSRRLEA